MKIVDWLIYYKDEGPGGPCAQVVSVTSPWRRLYQVRCTYGRVREICGGLIVTDRLKPKIDLFCLDPEEAGRQEIPCIRLLNVVTGKEDG